MSAGLTGPEHDAMELTVELWNALVQIVGDEEPVRRSDLNELYLHIHAIQNAILAQAAARAHVGRYRLLGEQP